MDNNTINYSYVPGPFLRVLKDAFNSKDKDKKFVLVIEEINRANAAAVFGDTFQLLDRNENGESEYRIKPSSEMAAWLKNENCQIPKEGLFIPSNMYIWATMNSADQGVFALDTAFKRRWDFEYIGIDNGEEKVNELLFKFKDGEFRWNNIRKSINRKLIEKGINEDKQLGPFFVKSSRNSKYIDTEQFKSKVLMYLFEDAARSCRSFFFGDELKTYSEICRKLDESGLKAIFTFLNESSI